MVVRTFLSVGGVGNSCICIITVECSHCSASRKRLRTGREFRGGWGGGGGGWTLVVMRTRSQRLGLVLTQEIIKVREWIPHIGPLTKVILLKLFLDIVSGSSEEGTRAMRGLQVEGRRNGGNVILYVSISFQNRDVFWTLGRLFGRPGFRLFCAHLAVLFMRF